MLIALIMDHPWSNELQRDVKYFSETIYLKKIWLFLKLIRDIHYSDNSKRRLVLIMGHLWVMIHPVDLNGYSRNIYRRTNKLHKIFTVWYHFIFSDNVKPLYKITVYVKIKIFVVFVYEWCSEACNFIKRDNFHFQQS